MTSERSLPERTREYLSHAFDSRNWDRFRPRQGDVVISTSYRSGTTWMQNIVVRLVFRDGPKPPAFAVSPWLDKRSPGAGEIAARLEAQAHRRIVKSHLPLDALPYYRRVRYIVLVRDPRDVFMSFWTHYSEMTEAALAAVNDPAVLVGPPLPRCPEDVHALWARWVGRGWFEWESEGWPHSGNLHHTASWWRFRHLDNILFVHFRDLLADLPGEVARVAAFLGVELPPERREEVAAAVRFDALKSNAAASVPVPPEAAQFTWKDGLGRFFNRGDGGRWQGVLTACELAMLDAAKMRCLTPGCAAYLDAGRAAWPAEPSPRLALLGRAAGLAETV